MRLLKALIEALFRILFEYECHGEHRIPAVGPAVVASNHPSYLDPVLLSLQVQRPIRFMAWDALFKVPIVGSLIRTFGAFPVNVRRGMGREAYARAKALVEAGEVVGIFPEGQRSHTGWMEPQLREGAARLAWETGAPLVPASIKGAFRAWPYFRSVPHPARIIVRFHEPIDPGPYRALAEDQALPALLHELRQRVDRSLLPGVKADLRLNALYARLAPPPRLFEWLPALVLGCVLWLQTGSWHSLLPSLAYLVYLVLDVRTLPQGRLAKWTRNASAVWFLALWAPTVLDTLGLTPVPAPAALLALMGGALFPYFHERARTSLAFLRGLVVVSMLELPALWLWPVAAGPHVALPLFAAAFAIAKRTVFWRYAATVLLAYLAAVPWLLQARAGDLLPHAALALAGFAVTRLLPRPQTWRGVAPAQTA